ncbi:MAG: precorrin-6y C5,15-methyltransferase (decarboxylating) subunit CbiE [Alphaproteobacteria bacterium]|nr:precorrin-6y C5,15-methyltransferase (decarboxylating) subunit CbiE [Alphaproteobacteria bacterium]
MTGKWLSIVGVGDGGLGDLSSAARALMDRAELFVGGERHLAMLPADDPRERLPWPNPLAAAVDEIERRRGRQVCVLATGDPMQFGIGVTLAKRIPIDEMTIVPGVSAFTLACARLGWPLAETACLTLHGRPVDLLRSSVQPGARILALSEDGATPGAVAAVLREMGYGPSRLVVLEHMDGENERRIDGTAADWSANRVADFNTLAIDCVAGPDARRLPRVPGLPDDAFVHDGQLTKREVRSMTLAALAPVPGQLLWDVGAGCGSVAIEWLRSHATCRAVAIEREPKRIAMIADNAAALGVPTLEIVEGVAPAALAGLDPPDAAFVGGGTSGNGVLAACWDVLKPGGRLVANVVTLEGERALGAWQSERGGELRRISVARAEPIGPHHGWRPLMTVTQYTGVKP